jgi:glycosyltransferase involved in cell wall biosynthesis
MRILQLVTRFDFGGAENHVRELCNELVANNHQVILVSRNGGQKELLDNRVVFIPIPSLVSNLILAQAILIVYLNFRHKIDVIHAHQRLSIITACLAGFISRVPVVATVHGRVKHDLRSPIARKLASKIIFVRYQALSNLDRFKTIKPKSIYIPNGIVKPKIKPNFKSNVIGYISRIDKRHFEIIKLLIQATEKIKRENPAIKLMLIGDGEKVEELKALVNETNLKFNDKAIVYLGFVKDIDLLNSFPELIFGVGRVAIEGLIRGANVISLKSNRMGRVITLSNYKKYIITNFIEIDGISPTLETIYNELKLYYQKRDEYRTEAPTLALKIENDFNIGKTTQRIIEVYSTVS